MTHHRKPVSDKIRLCLLCACPYQMNPTGFCWRCQRDHWSSMHTLRSWITGHHHYHRPFEVPIP